MCNVITWLICIFLKPEYLWNKEIFEKGKLHFSSPADHLLMFKEARKGFFVDVVFAKRLKITKKDI